MARVAVTDKSNSQRRHRASLKGPGTTAKKLEHAFFTVFIAGCLRTYLQADEDVVKSVDCVHS